jgi:hypothetical protein
MHILLPTSASHATSSGTVSNIRHSVVDLSPPTTEGGPFASLTLKNIKRSLLVCGQVVGPAHITGVENSVITVACRQFRMHASKNIVVYLHCTSRPIIEDCEEICFAPLPDKYVSASTSRTNLARLTYYRLRRKQSPLKITGIRLMISNGLSLNRVRTSVYSLHQIESVRMSGRT